MIVTLNENVKIVEIKIKKLGAQLHYQIKLTILMTLFQARKVDEGEKVEDALKRELSEETSLDIEPTDILSVY